MFHYSISNYNNWEWSSGLDGATLTLTAFEKGVGSVGRIIIA